LEFMNVHWLPFLAVAVVACVVPGPDFAVIMRASVVRRRAGLAAMAGTQSGLCVHLLAATAGLSLILARSAIALTAIQLAGAAYLIYLGVRILLDARRPSPDAARSDAAGPGTSYRQGLVTNLTNPKAILFFASILPQFISHSAPLAPQILILGVIDIAMGTLILLAVISAASRLARILSRPRARQRWDRLTGSVMLGLGIFLAISRA
jgi:threonine/homoserine/homoserine lactone efflux protein